MVADKLSRLGQTIQTEWSLLPEVFQTLCSRWHWPQIDLFAKRFNNKLPLCHQYTQPVMGGSGCIRLPTSIHIGQSGGEAAGLPIQENHSDSGWPNMPWFWDLVAWFWDLVAMSSQIPLILPSLPNLLTQPFNQIPHRNLTNLNLHAWLLEPQQSRSKASLKQWQKELRLLKDDQPDQSMRQSGPFLQSGASAIMTSLCTCFRTGSCSPAPLTVTGQPLLINWAPINVS